MKTAVIFCGARRTEYCEEILKSSGFTLTNVCAGTDKNPAAQLSVQLKENSIVLMLGTERGGGFPFAADVFKALGVPVTDGVPQGVLMLKNGSENNGNGWLVESSTQAVALLPDKPELLAQLLPVLQLRLNGKFKNKQSNASLQK